MPHGLYVGYSWTQQDKADRQPDMDSTHDNSPLWIKEDGRELDYDHDHDHEHELAPGTSPGLDLAGNLNYQLPCLLMNSRQYCIIL